MLRNKSKDRLVYSKMIHWKVSQAIYRISDGQGVKYDALNIEGKSQWLKDNIQQVLDSIIVKNGSGWEGIRGYRISVVQGDGTDAVLFFEKKR